MKNTLLNGLLFRISPDKVRKPRKVGKKEGEIRKRKMNLLSLYWVFFFFKRALWQHSSLYRRRGCLNMYKSTNVFWKGRVVSVVLMGRKVPSFYFSNLSICGKKKKRQTMVYITRTSKSWRRKTFVVKQHTEINSTGMSYCAFSFFF